VSSDQRGRHRDAGDGPSFGIAPGGHVHVELAPSKRVLVDAELVARGERT
jgi:hypothetical protein